MDGEQRSVCPLCDGKFEGDETYVEHLRVVHDLVDDEGLDAPAEAAGLDLGVLAAAAAALAQPDDEPQPVPEAVAQDAPAATPATGGHQRRRALAAASGVAALVVAVWLAGSGGGPSPSADGGDAGGPADGSFGPVGGAVEVLGTTVVPGPGVPSADGGGQEPTPPGAVVGDPPPTSGSASAPPAGRPAGPTAPPAPPTTDPGAPTTTRPPLPPPPPPPPPPSTSVTATQATVVSCTKVAGERTLVYSYVLTGSTTDGRHEVTITARVSEGPITVTTVVAVEADGGDPATVWLQPGPVTCD